VDEKWVGGSEVEKKDSRSEVSRVGAERAAAEKQELKGI
jgi:hypothetical protein